MTVIRLKRPVRLPDGRIVPPDAYQVMTPDEVLALCEQLGSDGELTFNPLLAGIGFDLSAAAGVLAQVGFKVAAELLRVCRPGGTIAMANWTKEGFIGQMLGVVSKFIAPPGMPSPLLWGDPETVRARFGSSARELRLERVQYRFDYPFSPSEVVDFFRDTYGPTTRAFAVLAEVAASYFAMRGTVML